MSLHENAPALEDTSTSGEDYSITVVPARTEAHPMTVALKRGLKANEYEARAREAYASAEASPLDQVRERQQAAGDRWMEMADQQRSAGDDADRRAV